MSFIGKNIRKIRTVKKLSQAAFAELFSLARPSVGAYEEGRTEPKIDTIIAIAGHFGLSTDALLRKELSVNELYSMDILKGAFDPTQMPPALGKSSKQEAAPNTGSSAGRPQEEPGVPLVDRDTTLEYIVNIGNRDFISKLPRILLPQEEKGLHRAFIHSGNEMYHNESGLRQGDVLMGRLLATEKLSGMKPEKLFTFVTRERIFTRRLSAAGQKSVELKADNPAFEAISLPAGEILEVWETTGIWTQQLAPPALLENKMLQLESRLETLEEKLNKLAKKGN